MKNAKAQRGMVMGLALMGILALTIAGLAAVYMASGEIDMAGNLRRQHQLQMCAGAGLQSAIVQLPTVGPTNYKTAESQTALQGHISNSGFSPGVEVLPASALASVVVAGENTANRLNSAPGKDLYRVVMTCQDSAGASKAEVSGAVLYGAGR